MRNKLCYLFANMALLSACPVVLFFVLLGVDIAFEIRTFWGFIFMMIGGGYVMACGVAMAINIKVAFKD